MPSRVFVRRREVYVPTVWGWLVIALAGAALLLFLGRGAYGFLAVNAPVGAKLLVVEGWMPPDALDQAVRTFRAGGYERVVTTGGTITTWPAPPQRSYAELAADYLKLHGLADVPITAVPTPVVLRDRTYRSAASVRDWAARSGLKLESLDVYSQGTHARRSRLLYRLAFGPEVRIGVYAAGQASYEGHAWWSFGVGVRDVLEQAVELAWVTLFFWPPAPGSAQ